MFSGGIDAKDGSRSVCSREKTPHPIRIVTTLVEYLPSSAVFGQRCCLMTISHAPFSGESCLHITTRPYFSCSSCLQATNRPDFIQLSSSGDYVATQFFHSVVVRRGLVAHVLHSVSVDGQRGSYFLQATSSTLCQR